MLPIRFVVRNLLHLFLLGVMLNVPCIGKAAYEVKNLKCEFRSNPVGIDRPNPRFEWQVASTDRGSAQSAYQVLVASSPHKLKPGTSDLWDTGKCQSSNTLQITYEGTPLTSNQRAYWTVRSWDQSNNPSPWSSPAEFTTSLLPSAEWNAGWIGIENRKDTQPDAIESAKWIWSPESQDAKDPGGVITGRAAGGAVRYFKKTFQLPSDADLENGMMMFTADNKADVYVNGRPIGSQDDWKQYKNINPGSTLKPGETNIIAVQVNNTGSTPNAAGLILALTVPTRSGTAFTLVTDSSWESSRAPDADWHPEWVRNANETPRFEPVKILGSIGIAPWHRIARGEHPTIPILRKKFTAPKSITHAIVHTCGLGHYVLSINGEKVGDHFLDPPWSKYEKTAFYNSFDVTGYLHPGENVIGVMLGKGFYNTAGDRRIHGAAFDNPLALILQAHITYEDGTTATISSDTTWKWAPGPYTHNAILGGTDYDAQKLPRGWDTPAFDDKEWKTAQVTTAPQGHLTAAFAPPMRTFKELNPISVEEPKPGQFVYDFGQNASATPRLKVKGKAGQTIKLTWAEQRDGQDPSYTNNGKGPVNQSGIGHGWITYTLRGDEQDEEWFCDLFYTGYQYLELTGGVPKGHSNPEGLPVVSELVSVPVYTNQEPVGTFQTSNEMYNRIDRMIDAAVRSNFGHVFTDCPTREKLGWLEVPWLMWASVASRYDMAAFAEKISLDISDSQLPNGQILTVAPSYPNFVNGFHYTPEWGAAGVFLPWYLYQWYADTSVLERNYDMMRNFVDYMESTSDNHVAAPGLGDWYDYWPGEKLGASRFTPPDLTATAVFAGCADIVSSSAEVLGKVNDVAKYSALASEIRKAFNDKFRTGPGQYAHTSSPQTAHAMALVFNMVPESERAAAAKAIVDDLRTREWQQTSGDVGYRFLINALTQTGHSDVIFNILNRDKIGSYAYLVNSGWTSLPEAWNANPTSSMNHCMLGHIQEWFTQHLVGIAPHPEDIAWGTVVIQPTPGDGVTSASGTYQSPRGPVSVAWEVHDDSFTCDIEIPANTRGLVRLPIPSGSDVFESGKTIGTVLGISHLGREKNRDVYQVGSGRYRFLAKY